MSGWAFGDSRRGLDPQLSGVHESPTQPAPYIEELEDAAAHIGSIPRAALCTQFEAVVSLRDGRTRGFEARLSCSTEGLREREQLYARASFEKTAGELGRAFRELALPECSSGAVYVGVHPEELKDGFLVRPDDPLCSHDGEVFLQVSQPRVCGLAEQVLRELGSRSGVSLVIDDFGTGPASLQQVIELEPAAVKLGCELVTEIDRSPRKQAAARRLVELFKSLGAVVVAKGVANDEEAAALRACGVPLAQGLAFGGPAALPSLPALSGWPK